jgi:sterol desaturase/sphingolipid hydroxylase (fatty acid hydroxylase superfamily)
MKQSMKNFKIENKGTARLFQNDFLEFLSRTHFIIPVVLYLLIGMVSVGYVAMNFTFSILSYIVLIISGVILFTLFEYFVHRYIFHFNATTKKQEKLQYNIHGVHHEFPRDKDRLVMPLVLSIALAIGFFFLYKFLFGESGYLIFAGFISGYSFYLTIHYAVHALKPPKNFLKYYWKHHSMHHYSSVHSNFSVSFPWWDNVFGTLPPEVYPKSDTAKSALKSRTHTRT